MEGEPKGSSLAEILTWSNAVEMLKPYHMIHKLHLTVLLLSNILQTNKKNQKRLCHLAFLNSNLLFFFKGI